MAKTFVAMVGFGMADEEVTPPEVLKAEGDNTSHVGKWHIGDIAESLSHNLGFDLAAFPMQQQAHTIDRDGELPLLGHGIIRDLAIRNRSEANSSHESAKQTCLHRADVVSGKRQDMARGP